LCLVSILNITFRFCWNDSMVLYNHSSTVVLLFETHIQLHTFYFDHNICFSVHSVRFGIWIHIYSSRTWIFHYFTTKRCRGHYKSYTYNLLLRRVTLLRQFLINYFLRVPTYKILLCIASLMGFCETNKIVDNIN